MADMVLVSHMYCRQVLHPRFFLENSAGGRVRSCNFFSRSSVKAAVARFRVASLGFGFTEPDAKDLALGESLIEGLFWFGDCLLLLLVLRFFGGLTGGPIGPAQLHLQKLNPACAWLSCQMLCSATGPLWPVHLSVSFLPFQVLFLQQFASCPRLLASSAPPPPWHLPLVVF